MSLRKQAGILGIAPSYLSMLINEKRPWPDALRNRYRELVNSSVNTHRGNETPTGKSQDDSYLEMVPRKGLEPSLPKREADFKSAASAIPPPGLMFVEAKLFCVVRLPLRDDT